MSRIDTWMPLHIASHRQETARMNTLARGAYLELTMDYWAAGPLPDDEGTLANVARLTVKEWRAISAQVRAPFVLEGGMLRHPRIDAEREKAEQIAGKRSASASSRWSKPDANASANAEQTDSNSNANASGLDIPGMTQIHKQIQKEGSLRSPTREPEGFDQWWSEYPRKDAKGAAQKMYAKALKQASAADLLTGVRLYPFQSDPQFIPMPATWLNQERWKSAHEAPDLTRPNLAPGPGKLDYLQKYMRVA